MDAKPARFGKGAGEEQVRGQAAFYRQDGKGRGPDDLPAVLRNIEVDIGASQRRARQAGEKAFGRGGLCRKPATDHPTKAAASSEASARTVIGPGFKGAPGKPRSLT